MCYWFHAYELHMMRWRCCRNTCSAKRKRRRNTCGRIYCGDIACRRKVFHRFCYGTMLEDADKVYDVAMSASGKVIPLIAFCIDFEGGCLFISERRTIPIGIASDVLRTMSLLLEIIHDGLLFDVV